MKFSYKNFYQYIKDEHYLVCKILNKKDDFNYLLSLEFNGFECIFSGSVFAMIKDKSLNRNYKINEILKK